MKRITKHQAKKLFAEGKEIILCPAKLMAGGMWHPECTVTLDRYVEDARRYESYPSQLWKGDIASTAWDLMYNSWAFYNTCYEAGYYAHYYIK